MVGAAIKATADASFAVKKVDDGVKMCACRGRLRAEIKVDKQRLHIGAGGKKNQNKTERE